jgi:hypothetical protein
MPLSPDWFQALGEPIVWAMALGKQNWERVTMASSESYDSLALTWPLVTSAGQLSSRSAFNLVRTADKLADALRRKALPMPLPADVDVAVGNVRTVVESLDIGFSVGVAFGVSQPEEALWRTASALGLGYDPDLRAFVWRQNDSAAQASVYPLDEPQQFTASGMQSQRQHTGMSVGFSVPLVFSPAQSMAATYRIAEEFGKRFQGLLFSEDNVPLTPAMRLEYQKDLHEAVAAFSRAGVVPGSAEAQRLFGT